MLHCKIIKQITPKGRLAQYGASRGEKKTAKIYDLLDLHPVFYSRKCYDSMSSVPHQYLSAQEPLWNSIPSEDLCEIENPPGQTKVVS